MTIFFSRFGTPPDALNRYRTLFALLRSLDLDVTIASLNYEVIAEASLVFEGWYPFYEEPAPANPPFPLIRMIKPHGSCNLLPNLGTNRILHVTAGKPGEVFSGTPGELFKGSCKQVDLEEVERIINEEVDLSAAMSLYAPGKPTVVCAESVARMRVDWRTAAEQADVLLAIGASPALESDPHIWDPLVHHPSAPLLFIGDPGDELPPLIGSRLVCLGPTFEAGLAPLEDHLSALKD